MRSSRILIAAVAVGVVLSACTPTPVVTPTPTPTPTFACTPEAGGTPSPCSQAEFEEMKAKDALYAEAEAVYRRTVQIRMDAYSGRPIPDLTTVAVGSGLESLTTDLQRGITIKSGELIIVSVARNPGQSREGSIVALTSCIDTTQADIYDRGTKITLNPRGIESTFYRRDGEALKLAYIGSKGSSPC